MIEKEDIQKAKKECVCCSIDNTKHICLFLHKWLYKVNIPANGGAKPVIYRICKKCDYIQYWVDILEQWVDYCHVQNSKETFAIQS